jgi:hypothetical protein
MHPTNLAPWLVNWAWSLPLIVLTVVIHVWGLAPVGEKIVGVLNEAVRHRGMMLKFAIVMAGISLLVTFLHGMEAAVWAGAYRSLGALPDNKTAMLYSLSAMTTYGHANIFLKAHWQLMGAFEALDGMLLFGLPTAFLFAMIQRVWPLGRHDAK